MGGNGKPGFALLRGLKGASEPRRIFLLNSAHPDDEFQFFGGSAGKRGTQVRVQRHILQQDGSFGIKEEGYDGIAFYLTRGRMRGAVRGWPMLGNMIDYANIHDEMLWGFAERMKSLHKFVLHAKIDGASEEEIPDLLAAAGFATTPDAGQIVGTNEKWTIEAISPKLQSSNVTDMERVLRMIMAGSKGYPEAWTGSGQDVNRATLVGQNSVTFKRLRRQQKAIIKFFRTMADFQIVSWRKHGQQIPATTEQVNYDVIRTSLDDKDRLPMADAMQKLITAMGTAVSGGILPEAVAQDVVVTVLREFGFEITEKDLEPAEGEEPQLIKALRALQAQNSGPPQEPPQKEPDERQEKVA